MANLTSSERYRGAATGAFVGDALAMPAHWYYDRAAIRSDYGVLDVYRAPRRLHPDSVLSRRDYKADDEEADILGEDRVFWGAQSIHYHQHLRPGENTLNLKLLRVALDQLFVQNQYDRARYADRYVNYMRTPSEHHDTYLEACHRGFFRNLRSGTPAGDCAVEERHIGGMVAVVPLYAALRVLGSQDADARTAVLEHVSVTHRGELITDAANTLLTVASELWDGATIRESIDLHTRKQDLPYLGDPVARLATRADEQVIGPLYGSACDLPESLPATFYLAWKYFDSPRRGLVANTMVGGDNCHRGAVLGSLIGLTQGPEVFPENWRTGLLGHIPVEQGKKLQR